MRRATIALAVLLSAAPAAARDALPRDLPPSELVAYLKTGGEDARREACHRLGGRRDASAIPALGEVVVKDPSVRVKAECLQALERIGPNPQSAAFVAEALLKDPERKVRQEAADSLMDVNPQGGGAVAAAALAQEKDSGVRRQLCKSIERRAWKEADAAVIKVVSDAAEPVDVRKTCLESVVAIGSDAGLALAHKMMTDEPNEELRRQASAEIEHHPRPASLQFLCKALLDSNDRIAANAVNGLKRLGLKEGAQCLRDAAQKVGSDRLAGKMNKVADELGR